MYNAIMISSPSAIATISAIITHASNSSVPQIIKHAQSLSPNEWLSFFLGGAVGSLIILGFDKGYDRLDSWRKNKEEKKRVTNALMQEININIALTEKKIKLITDEPKISHTFTRYDYTWLDVYTNKILDFTTQDHINLFDQLSAVKRQMLFIKDHEDFNTQYVIAKQVLTSQATDLEANNQSLKRMNEELKTVLENIHLPSK